MTENILNDTLEHECIDNEAICTIVGQLKRHPTIQGILSPIVTTADFQSCFKCVPEKRHLHTQGYQSLTTSLAPMDQRTD
jgi:hypothetical protein